MDWQTLTYAFDHLTSSGVTFSTEQRVAIEASLIALQRDNQFSKVQLWGRIEGVENDYYIVCGIGKDYIDDRTYFYSTNDGLDWILLPRPNDLVKDLGPFAKGRFLGDPTADSETEFTPTGADDINEGDQWAFIKEEERLSATVYAITAEAAIVPRGALFKNPTGIIWENKTFNGLKMEDASQLHSYYHLKRPEDVWDKNIVVRADYNLTLDFLDSIARDCPIGSWSVQTNKAETLALVRSLYWPGATGWHLLNTPQYGWFYNGPGRKNWDVPFMIKPLPAKARASIPEAYPVFAEDAGEAAGDTSMSIAKREYSSRRPTM